MEILDCAIQCHSLDVTLLIEIPTEIAKQIPFGSTSVFVGIEGKLAGIICLEDKARTESIPAVCKIREMGLEVVMLTGDQQTSADAVAQKTGITNLHYGVRPEEKSKIINRKERNSIEV